MEGWGQLMMARAKAIQSCWKEEARFQGCEEANLGSFITIIICLCEEQ